MKGTVNIMRVAVQARATHVTAALSVVIFHKIARGRTPHITNPAREGILVRLFAHPKKSNVTKYVEFSNAHNDAGKKNFQLFTIRRGRRDGSLTMSVQIAGVDIKME